MAVRLGARSLTAIAFVLALAASAAWLVVPAYVGQTMRTGPDGETVIGPRTYQTLLEVNGNRMIRWLVLPILITSVPLLLPFRAVRIAAAVILTHIRLD